MNFVSCWALKSQELQLNTLWEMEWPSLSTGHSLKRKERYLYEHVRHSTA